MLHADRRTGDYLAALAEAVRPGLVLDFGTGSGPRRAAARAVARRVCAVEASDIAELRQSRCSPPTECTTKSRWFAVGPGRSNCPSRPICSSRRSSETNRSRRRSSRRRRCPSPPAEAAGTDDPADTYAARAAASDSGYPGQTARDRAQRCRALAMLVRHRVPTTSDAAIPGPVHAPTGCGWSPVAAWGPPVGLATWPAPPSMRPRALVPISSSCGGASASPRPSAGLRGQTAATLAPRTWRLQLGDFGMAVPDRVHAVPGAALCVHAAPGGRQPRQAQLRSRREERERPSTRS